MQLTAQQIELARTRPQQTRLYLSVFTPRTVMQCQINNSSIAKGARTIAYDTVSSGSYLNVEAGMTLLVGTTPGGKELGKIRIRSITASELSVAENSDVQWQDNAYLTVLRYWELWPIFPRLLQNPSNIEDVIFYKDYDIPYSNQNSVLGAFVDAGPHRAAFLEAGTAQIYYSSTGTYHVIDGTSLSYQWTFEGGNPTGSTSANPGYVNYSTPGHYVTRLYISGSNGSEDITYRYISIYDRPENGSNPPILLYEITDVSGSRGEGGTSFSVKIHEDIDIDDNSVVVLFSEDWYGDTKQSIGGNYPNASDIFYVGYVKKGTIRYSYRHKYTEFEVSNITGLMKDSVGFSVSTQSDINPDTWYKILDLDIRRAIYHYLKWHTTVLSISDFQFLGTDQKIQYFDSDRTSMFDAIDNLMRGTLVGSLVSDRQSKLWAEIDASAYPNPTGTFTSFMDISKRDWVGEPYIEERIAGEQSYLERGGIAFSGIVTGSWQALMACAPGTAPTSRGQVDTEQGLAIAGQDQLNSMVGNMFANMNSRFGSVQMDMSANFRNFDIAPQEAVRIHLDETDTNIEAPVDILGIPSDISWKYDHKSGLLLPSVTFKGLVNGPAGDTIIVPEPPDVGDGFQIPTIQIPPLPIFEFPMPSGTPTGTSSGMPYIHLYSASAGVAAISFSRGAWGDYNKDASGLWVQVLYTGLYLVTAKMRAFGGDLDADSIPAFIAKRSPSGWGTIYKSLNRPSISNGGVADNWISDFDAELTAIVYLYELESIGIGMTTTFGGSSTERILQVVRLDLG